MPKTQIELVQHSFWVLWNLEFGIHFSFSFTLFFSFRFSSSAGEVIYTAATTKPAAMPTSSLLRNSLSVNSRHHHRTTSGMTSSSSATSSNSNNLNSDRFRDNSSRGSDIQKAREDDSPKDNMNRLNQQNGRKPFFFLS